jgi:hypothetical protein
MASATDTGVVYHAQAVGGPAAIVSYAAFRKLLGSQVEDVDDVLAALVPDAGMIHTGLYTLWVTFANAAFVPPPRTTVGAPVGVAAIVTHGVVPVGVTTVSVRGKKR